MILYWLKRRVRHVKILKSPPWISQGKDKQSIDKVDLASMDSTVHIYYLDPSTTGTSHRQEPGMRSMVDFEKYLSFALTSPPPTPEPLCHKVNRRQLLDAWKIYRKESGRDKAKEKAIRE